MIFGNDLPLSAPGALAGPVELLPGLQLPGVPAADPRRRPGARGAAVRCWCTKTRIGRAGARRRVEPRDGDRDGRRHHAAVHGRVRHRRRRCARWPARCSGRCSRCRSGMGENILILAFVVIVIGGIGSIRGALVGAMLVGVVDTLGRTLLQHAVPRVPAAAMGERRRPGDRVDRGLRVHGGGARDQAAGPVPGARLMAPAAEARIAARRRAAPAFIAAAWRCRRCLQRARRSTSTSAWRAAIVVYAIAATSLNLVLGYGGMVSFGHAAFFGLGAYVTGILISEGVPSGLHGWPRCDRRDGARRAGHRRDLAAHARRLLHHDHAGVRADAVLPGQLDEGLRRRRGAEHPRALARSASAST